MSRDDVRTNLRSWEVSSAEYQTTNASQLDRWERLGWGIWDVPEDQVNALGEVTGLDALELGCGACQFGIRVAKRGARVTGLDFSANQLRAGQQKMEASGVRFSLVRADAERLPFADASFDLVFCDHGATSFTDPSITIPEASRVLRPGGRLVFNIASPFVWTCWGDGEAPAGRALVRPYFGGGRTVWDDPDGPSVEWQLTYGDWIRVFHASGLSVEDLIELRPSEDATTTYTSFAPHAWARDYPGEALWKVRKV